MNLKIEDAPNLVRDSNTRAIINTDSDSYTIFVNKKKKLRDQHTTIKDLQRQLEELLLWKQQITNLLDQKTE
jgi:hypothetical protein